MIRPDFTQDLQNCYNQNYKNKLYNDQYTSLFNKLKHEYEYLNKEKLRCKYDSKNPYSLDQIKKIEHDINCNRAELSHLLRQSVNIQYL